MAPARLCEILGAHCHLPVETEAELALESTANNPAASTIHEAAHDPAPNGTKGLSLTPPAGPKHMHQNLIDLNVLPILEFDPTRSQASGRIDDANVPVTARECGNLPTQSISAPCFEDFSSRARALSRGTSHSESSEGAQATSNVTHGLPESNLLIGRLPKLELLTELEEHMLHQRFLKEHPQSLESAHSVSPPQEHHPNCSPEPTQERSADELLGLSPHESLIDHDWGMHQGVGCASSSHFSSSSNPCAPWAMNRPPNLLPSLYPNKVEAAPLRSITVLDDVQAQLAICTNTPSSADSASVQNGSPDSESTVDDGLTAQSIRRMPHPGQANRYPERPIAARVPTPCVELAVPPMRFGINDILSPRPGQYVTPRANHLWSECERRMMMRDDIIRTRPPSDALKTWLEDEAKLLMEMMKQISLCEEMEAVEIAIKHLQAVAGSTWLPNYETNIWVPQNADTWAMTAVTVTASGTRVSQASMLSTNVTLLAYSHSCFLTTTSPQDRSSGLLDRIMSTLEDFRLEVLSVTFITRENMIVYSVHFRIRQHEQVLLDDLYSTLQTLVNNFSSATPSRRGLQ